MERCRSCKQPIRWAFTEKKRRIPFDPDPHPTGNLIVEAGVARVAPAGSAPTMYLSHFATCPQAAAHRKAR
jgi:hypothetical protein